MTAAGEMISEKSSKIKETQNEHLIRLERKQREIQGWVRWLRGKAEHSEALGFPRDADIKTPSGEAKSAAMSKTVQGKRSEAGTCRGGRDAADRREAKIEGPDTHVARRDSPSTPATLGNAGEGRTAPLPTSDSILAPDRSLRIGMAERLIHPPFPLVVRSQMAGASIGRSTPTSSPRPPLEKPKSAIKFNTKHIYIYISRYIRCVKNIFFNLFPPPPNFNPSY